MTKAPNEDQPGFIAEKPEHCFACFHQIRPVQTYYLTTQHEVFCADYALDEGLIRVREDFAVEVKHDRLLVRRGEVEDFPHWREAEISLPQSQMPAKMGSRCSQPCRRGRY